MNSISSDRYRRRSADCIRITLNPTKKIEFNVNCGEQRLTDAETFALLTDSTRMGGWNAQKVVLFEPSEKPGVWTTKVDFVENEDVRYRYLVVEVDDIADRVHVNSWETHIKARGFNVQHVKTINDTYGRIDSKKREVQAGWLDSGVILQFKIFPRALRFEESSQVMLTDLRLKVQPVDIDARRSITNPSQVCTRYGQLEYGQCVFRHQEQHGVPYSMRDTLLVQATLSSLQSTGFSFKLYQPKENSDTMELIAYQLIQPKRLTSYDGEIDVKLAAPVHLNLVASLKVNYMVTKSAHMIPRLSVTLVDYWPADWKDLHVGHRGLGKSLNVKDTPATLPENTIASMKATSAIYADLAEFDVMLTKDLVPIVHHDFDIYIKASTEEPLTMDHLKKVPIKDYTYEELKALQFYSVFPDSSIIERPAASTVHDVEMQSFPRLEDLLEGVDKALGYNIEIKWPQQKANGEWESKMQHIDKNRYVDAILHVVLQSAADRLIFFSSFDPDICVMLRYKQSMYPVMFILSGKKTYADPRTHSVRDAVNHAQLFNLMGVVLNSSAVLEEPNNITLATTQNKLVFVWGADLRDLQSVNSFLAKGITGVIYDRIDQILPKRKVRNYTLERDLVHILPEKADSDVSCECYK